MQRITDNRGEVKYRDSPAGGNNENRKRKRAYGWILLSRYHKMRVYTSVKPTSSSWPIQLCVLEMQRVGMELSGDMELLTDPSVWGLVAILPVDDLEWEGCISKESVIAVAAPL